MAYDQYGKWVGPSPAPAPGGYNFFGKQVQPAAPAGGGVAAPPPVSTAAPQSDLTMQAQQNLAGALAKPLDFNGLPQLDYGAGAAQGARDAAYNQAASRLDPMFDQRESKLRTQLLNQGLDPSSQAYSTALENFGRDRNDAYAGAQNAAFGQGMAAQNQSFGQSQMARQQMLAEMLQGRSVPLQEYGALTGLDLSKAGYGLDAGRFNLDLSKFGADQNQQQWANKQYESEAFNRFLESLASGGATLAKAVIPVPKP